MDHNVKEIEQASDLAEKVANAELKLGESRRSKASASVIRKQQDELNASTYELLGNILAERLLPQARIIVRAEHRRLNVIVRSTLLGQLRQVIDMLRRNPPTVDNKAESEIQPFCNEKDNEALNVLSEALGRNDNATALGALMVLLQSAMINLAKTNLPPPPPPYEMPEEEEV